MICCTIDVERIPLNHIRSSPPSSCRVDEFKSEMVVHHSSIHALRSLCGTSHLCKEVSEKGFGEDFFVVASLAQGNRR